MNAHNSLLDNFSSMHDEFSSSNNRMIRAISTIFDEESKDLENSLDYFNGEYVIVDKRKLMVEVETLRRKILNDRIAHVMEYQKRFDRDAELLKQTMCNFFEAKLAKGESAKKKMSGEVKKILDRMCDFDFIGFEEEMDDDIYNFKVNFEFEHIRDEYCKDDFNKIMRSFEHSLFERLRSVVAVSVVEKQEIVSRHISKAYDIIDGYKKVKR